MKFKELDRQEAERNKAMVSERMELPKLDAKKEEKVEPIIEIKEEAKPTLKTDVVVDENPKINVDKDSTVIADNVISDDEFFDDFFGEE